MNPSVELKVLQLHHASTVSTQITFDYLFKLHGLLLTQQLLSKEILIQLGAEPEEVNMMIQEMTKECYKLAESMALAIRASADQSVKP